MPIIIGTPNSKTRYRRGEGAIYEPEAPTGEWAFLYDPPSGVYDGSAGCGSTSNPRDLTGFSLTYDYISVNPNWGVSPLASEIIRNALGTGEVQEFSLNMSGIGIFTDFFAGSAMSAEIGIYMRLRYTDGTPDETFRLTHAYSTADGDSMKAVSRSPSDLYIKATRANVSRAQFGWIATASCLNSNGFMDYLFNLQAKVTEPVPAPEWRIYITADQGAGYTGIAEVVWSDAGGPISQLTYTQDASASEPGYPAAQSADGDPNTVWRSPVGTTYPVQLQTTISTPATITSVDITATLDAAGTDALQSFEIQRRKSTGVWETTKVVSGEPSWSAGETRTYLCG